MRGLCKTTKDRVKLSSEIVSQAPVAKMRGALNPHTLRFVTVNDLRTGITIMIYTLVVIALGVKPQPQTHSEV